MVVQSGPWQTDSVGRLVVARQPLNLQLCERDVSNAAVAVAPPPAVPAPAPVSVGDRRSKNGPILTVAEAILLLVPIALWSLSGDAPSAPLPMLPPLAEFVVVVEVGVWGVLCAS